MPIKLGNEFEKLSLIQFWTTLNSLTVKTFGGIRDDFFKIIFFLQSLGNQRVVEY